MPNSAKPRKADSSPANFKNTPKFFIISSLARLILALIGIAVALNILMLSIFVLVDNEVSIDWSRVANQAIVLSPNTPMPAAQGKLVTLTGPIASAPPIGDNLYLKPGPYAVLFRTVEMYAWKQTRSRNRYTYEKIWTDTPSDSTKFKHRSHSNPQKYLSEATFVAPTVTIGRYGIKNPSQFTILNKPTSCVTDDRISSRGDKGGITLPETPRILLIPKVLIPSKPQPYLSSSFFLGRGSPQRPSIGDIRICYSALANGETVTIVGQLQGDSIVPITYRSQSFLRLMPGNRRTAIAAIAELTVIDQWQRWQQRIYGFLFLWLSFVVIAYICLLCDIEPEQSRSVPFLSLGFVAFVLSSITILGAALFHSPDGLGVAFIFTLVSLASLIWIRRYVRA